jgi:hypothetical protein
VGCTTALACRRPAPSLEVLLLDNVTFHAEDECGPFRPDRHDARTPRGWPASPENAQIFDFTLSEEDLAELDGLDRTGRMDRALERNWW